MQVDLKQITEALRHSQVLWEDDERVFRRGRWLGNDDERLAALFVVPAAEHPSGACLDRFRHEFELRDELDRAWAARPLELMREAGQTMLVLEDPGCEPLEGLLGAPLEIGSFLRLAVSMAAALGKLHQRGLVHKDIKPANILVNEATRAVRLTGFGIASRLARERQSPQPLETLAGTLAYMAPEQTGRMNRSIDSRSDLYALGVTFYQMLIGALPFDAAEPMEWVHCHLARRPVPPAERLNEIPSAVSAIVMKLLAKRAEDRYQTAIGLERDLKHCQSDWERQVRIDEFPPGEHDWTDRPVIPEKLYGRQREVETLLAAFDRAAKGGAPELVLISGYAGIGKSAVVSELAVLVPPHCLFASGKFDQYKRDVPYSTLAQALRGLIRALLGKDAVELTPWRETLREALGPNAGLMMDLAPELKLIIGEAPPVPELTPQDAKRRFQWVFSRFIGVFARPEHPLALFLDDLQWLDAATLDLLEELLTRSDLQHLLLIGAYRNNEVDAAHPLMRKLSAVRSAGGQVQEIALAPLAPQHLKQLLADTLRCESGYSAALAQLVQEKTGGNPFFSIQFISSLAEEQMLTFDHDVEQWSWDLDRIHAKGYTDNVADLMVAKLIRLPARTQMALQQLACLGNVAEVAALATVLEGPHEQVHVDLWDGVLLGLIERHDGTYKFIHDRVHEAAYSMIPAASRAETHLRIGRLLLAASSLENREERIFDIVNHLNRGAPLIASREERENLAELNLIAGKRAKGSTAYVSALRYLIAGAELLADDVWERRRDLIFALELERAECESLTGELAAADKRLTALSIHLTSSVERVALTFLHMSVCTELLQSDRAVAVALDYLRHVNIGWSLHPTEDEVLGEYEQVLSQLRGRAIDEVIDLPRMSDPESLATVSILTKVRVPAKLYDENLSALTLCRAVNLSLERGNCDASCLAYVMFGQFAIQRFHDYKTACRFGQVGYELAKDLDSNLFQAGTYAYFAALISPWMEHVRSASSLARRAFIVANQIGDFTSANDANIALISELLVAGDPLSDVQREAEVALSFAEKAHFSGYVVIVIPQLALIRTLRGETPKFGRFDDERIEELSLERRFADSPYLGIHECWYWIRKMQARYFSGEYQDALEASKRAQRALWMSSAQFEEAECHFYSALCHSASCVSATAEQRAQHLKALAVHHDQLENWAEHCPENFENRAELVSAEIAQIEGRDLEAMHLYEQAIRSSRANGFVHNEAIAYERASIFYRTRGFEQFADTYLRNARTCYASWGADGKVRQLDHMYPSFRPERPLSGPVSTISTPVEGLELATVIRVSQAVSGEMVLERLLDIVMRKAMEHAGAERGLLIAARNNELQLVAESRTSGSDVIVSLTTASNAGTPKPESVLRYVTRTHESLLLDDAMSDDSFSADPYVAQHRVRSVLCLPLINQAKLSGILYLENNLAPRVFTPGRITLLKVLVSQAAISFENTRLYRDLEDREAKIRRLVDANILGIFIWNLDGGIIEANDAFLGMLQYGRDDLLSGRVRWTDLTPGEWRERDNHALTEVKRTGSVQPYEKEYLKRDGGRVPVLVGAALLQVGGNEGVAFVLDLTERKRAEATLRGLESDLAHMNRVSMMGELSASLAHEVKQPIAAARNNARAAHNFMNRQPPDWGEVVEAIGCVVSDVDRAADIIDRIGEQIKKAPPRREDCDLNVAIKEVIELARSITVRDAISVHTRLADRLPRIQGDRVQLQQVVLNLILNAVEAMASIEGTRELMISTERDRTGILVAVRDSGPGIDRAHLERVFQSFYTTKPGGTGMGLSVCRSIVQAHGGRLWADANEPRGAVFQFTLPDAESST